jgi:hypothetical protein
MYRLKTAGNEDSIAGKKAFVNCLNIFLLNIYICIDFGDFMCYDVLIHYRESEQNAGTIRCLWG